MKMDPTTTIYIKVSPTAKRFLEEVKQITERLENLNLQRQQSGWDRLKRWWSEPTWTFRGVPCSKADKILLPIERIIVWIVLPAIFLYWICKVILALMGVPL